MLELEFQLSTCNEDSAFIIFINYFTSVEVVTPIVRLRCTELDTLRKSKETTPFSGTTVTITKDGQALWFSKNIIPAIRKENELRAEEEFSPIYQHLGLYGYRADILKKFVSLPQGVYEQLEGLEQLRMLENGIKIQTILLDVNLGLAQAGVDSPEDIDRAEKIITKHGEPFDGRERSRETS